MLLDLKNQLDLRVYANPMASGVSTDLSPYAQASTEVGSPTVNTSGIVLNGTTQYVTYPDVASNSLFSRNELTLFAWFKKTALLLLKGVLSKWDQGDFNRMFRIYVNATSGTINCALSSDGTSPASVTTTTGISAGADVYVVMTWDGTQIKIYLNGVEDVVGFYSSGLLDSDERVAIGTYFQNDAGTGFFDGTIYQAGVAGRAWSPQLIQDLYLLGKDYRIIESQKELLFSENFKDREILKKYITSGGTFAIEYQNTTGKYYLKCLTGTGVTLKIPTDNWNGANFTDTQTTIAGTPTITRNTSDLTITMSADDAITDIVVRRE